jgi:copper chaperone CopZ
MMETSTIEFSVNLTCGKCVRATEAALSGKEGINDVKVMR